MTTETPTTSTVLVSQPGIMCDSLHVMLKSLPRVEVVGTASGGLSADKLLNKQVVQLIVIDTNLPQEEVLALLGRVKKKNNSCTRSVVLTVTTKHDQKLLAAGADAVLLRNSSAQAFANAVQQTKPS